MGSQHGLYGMVAMDVCFVMGLCVSIYSLPT